MPDSLYRDMRVRELLLPHIGEIGTDLVKAALFDSFGSTGRCVVRCSLHDHAT